MLLISRLDNESFPVLPLVLRHIPNSITCGNLVCGCLSIQAAVQDDLYSACWWLLAAGILDFFDGLAARVLHAYSSIGKDLDSLADIVSFGVSPAFIVYHMPVYLIWKPIIWVIPVFSALRLAKFNNDPSQSVDFKGVPTPFNALFLCALSVISIDNSEWLHDVLVDTSFLTEGVLILMCYLMVSNIPLFSLKFKENGFYANRFKYLFLSITAMLAGFLHFSAAPFVLILYLTLSFIHFHSQKVKS